jgi:hypothetical protein
MATSPIAVHFVRDMTLRWPVRAGDFLLWFRHRSLFAGNDDLDVVDLWEMRDGDSVILTNRGCDIPSWFPLHPLETSGTLALKVLAKLKAGWEPSPPLDGPNVWRVMAGDRVAWAGSRRPGREPLEGVLCMVNFQECALVLGEIADPNANDPMDFGTLTERGQTPEGAATCRNAVNLGRALGGPNTIATGEWRLG